jgi:hypothetical protein
VSGAQLVGADAGNYLLMSSSADTSTAHVGPLEITAAATADDKTYDGNTDAVAHLSSGGVLSGDSVDLSYGTATFSDPSVAEGKTVTVTGLSISGIDAGNGSLLNTTATITATIKAP